MSIQLSMLVKPKTISSFSDTPTMLNRSIAFYLFTGLCLLSFQATGYLINRAEPGHPLSDIPKKSEMQRFVVLKSDFKLSDQLPDEGAVNELIDYYFSKLATSNGLLDNATQPNVLRS